MRHLLALLATLVLVSSLAGCGRLLGSRYDNFTAYYNTFYNARQEFEREEDKLLEAERPVERDRFLSVFVEPPENARSSAGFEKAIEKGADLLREHPESKWVDDALLLIGKARFYQSDWAGAEEKFREVIALGENKLEDEAWLWLGRALTAAERYDDAALALREGLGRDGVDERWAAPMRLALAEVDVRRNDLEAAVVSLEAGLEGLRDKELAARAAFLLGQVYEVQDQPAEAAAAYASVLEYGPRYELAYAAQLSQSLTLGLGQEPERGLAILNRMRRDDKNFQNLAEVELTRARVLAAAERPAEARDLLRDLLYDPDPTLRAGAVRGRIHYRLADIYRDGLRDYIRAAAHYDTAATVLRQPPAAEMQTTREAITDAQQRSSAFGSYARVSDQIAEMDSLLYLGGLDDEAFAATIEQIRQERQAEAEAEARERDRRRAEEGFGGVASGPGGFDEGRGGRDTGGNDQGGETLPGGDFGFLGYRNPVRVQDQLIGFQARWGDRPLVPNWRRAEAASAAVAVQGELQESIEGVGGVVTPDFAQEDLVDVSVIPRDPLSQQQMRLDLAAAHYELGNVLFLSLNEPSAAAEWYRRVLDVEAESALAQRAYFALAETQRALGNEAEADDLYRQVVDLFSESGVADQARERLGLSPREQVIVADSLAEAEALYALAFETWRAGEYASALDRMLNIGEQFPTTPVAARARLAAGALYTEWAAGDSTALLAPLPRLGNVALVAPAPSLPDSARVSSDTLGSARQEVSEEAIGEAGLEGAVADSVGGPVVGEPIALSDAALYDEPWLYALYATIEEDYPGTPYAERARATRTALVERYPLNASDLGEGVAGEADSLGGGERAVRPGPAEAPGAETLRRGEAVRADENGFSWAVSTSSRRPEMVDVVLALADLGYQTALFVDRTDTGIRFRALVGQFDTEEDALASREALPTVEVSEEEPFVVSTGVEARWIQDPRRLRRSNN